jgi:hypothetical protein
MKVEITDDKYIITVRIVSRYMDYLVKKKWLKKKWLHHLA